MAEVRLTILGEDKSGPAVHGLDLTEKALGMVKNAAAAMGIAISAAWVVATVKDMALMAARYETLGVSMNVVGNNAGYTSVQMGEFETKLRATGIAMIESRESLTMMASAHIDLAKSAELARIAQDAAVIGGINSSEAFARMTQGIQSGEVEVLRTIGINVNFENSYKKLSQQLGKSSDDLTDLEKVTARTNAVLEKGKDISGVYEAAMGTAGKQIQSMQRYMDNLKVVLGATFNDVLVIAVEAFTGALKTGNKEADDMAQKGQLKQWGRDLVMALAMVADGIAIAYKFINTFVITGVAGFEQLYFGATAFFQVLNGDFSGAKESFQSLLATGAAWSALMASNWEGTTKYQDAAKSVFAAQDDAAKKALASEKSAAAERARIEAGETSRAEAAAKAASLANQTKLTRELEALKTEKAAENALLKDQSGIASDILKAQYDQGLVTTASYYAQVGTIATAAAQARFDEAAAYLQKEEQLLASVGKNKGESSPEYATELRRNKQATAEMQSAQLDYAKVFVDSEAKKVVALKTETDEYAKIDIAMEESAGRFEAAEVAKQGLYRKSAEYMRLETTAMSGNEAALRAMGNLERSETVSRLEEFNKSMDAADQYTADLAKMKDEISALNGVDKTQIDAGAKLRDGLTLETGMRRSLELATAKGDGTAISGLNSKIDLQSILNARLQTEIDLINRKGVLTGAIVGFNGNTPIYANGYANSQQATGYVTNTQLTGSNNPTAAQIQNSPFVSLNSPFSGYLRSYDVGTPFVPRTGPALIHKGERILTAAENASGSFGGITLTGGLQVIIQGGDTTETTVNELAKELFPRLDKLWRMRRAA
jgi:hypothetical protein